MPIQEEWRGRPGRKNSWRIEGRIHCMGTAVPDHSGVFARRDLFQRSELSFDPPAQELMLS